MSEKIAAMIEEIKGLSVLELSELVHALEDTFGVSAAAVAAGPAVAAAGPVVEEKTEFDVIGRQDQGRRFQGRCRGSQGSARSCRRKSRNQVRDPYRIRKELSPKCGGSSFFDL